MTAAGFWWELAGDREEEAEDLLPTILSDVIFDNSSLKSASSAPLQLWWSITEFGGDTNCWGLFYRKILPVSAFHLVFIFDYFTLQTEEEWVHELVKVQSEAVTITVNRAQYRPRTYTNFLGFHIYMFGFCKSYMSMCV